MSERGLAGMVARDATLPGLGVLLDSERLSAALAREVRLTRVRYKPGSSVVVAFRDVDAGFAHGPSGAASAGFGAPADCCGWAASYTNDDKPAKTLRRSSAERPVRRLAGLPHAIEGGVFADRALGAGLEALGSRYPRLDAAATVLRHNPHRRVLLSVDGHIVKVAAGAGAGAGAGAAPVDLGSLAAAGVPLIVPEQWGDRVTATTRWGSGDLAEQPSDAHAAMSGAALATLHCPSTGAADADALTSSIRREMADAAAGLTAIDPQFEATARRLVAAAPTVRDRVMTHGDFSADQVLVGAGIRLIDFDRAGAGDPHRDLGSFFAAEVLATGGRGQGPAMLEGYRAGGAAVDDDSLRRWTAVSLLQRAAEPFRTARPGWHDEIRRLLSAAEGMLT